MPDPDFKARKVKDKDMAFLYFGLRFYIFMIQSVNTKQILQGDSTTILRTCCARIKENSPFPQKNIRFVTALDLIKCLK